MSGNLSPVVSVLVGGLKIAAKAAVQRFGRRRRADGLSRGARLMRSLAFVAAALLGISGILGSRLATGAKVPTRRIDPSWSLAADVRHDTSRPLRELVGVPPTSGRAAATPPAESALAEPANPGTGLAVAQNFPGFAAPGGPIPNIPASDTSGAVGPNHYVQTVNFAVTIYDKNGNIVQGPFSTSSWWNGFSFAPCAGGLSDEVVLYDHAAQRWFVSKFARQPNADGTTFTWYQCFAISQTSDPTGPFYRYAFFIDPIEFNDYPKFGIWPDAYYMTADRDKIFPGKGVFVAAFERNKMLNGQAAQSLVAKIDNGGARAGMLPADWDGETPPPAGSPNYFVRTLDPNIGWLLSAVQVWAFQVDWGSGTGSFALEDSLTPDPFNSNLCGLNPSCVPQPGTSVGLDPQAGGRPMFRLAYRNFGDHEALTFNQAVDAGDFPNHSGIRWYELRKSGANPWSIYQQNTFAPDGDHRWMGTMAMDRAGNAALGYNVSSGSVFPSIRIAGRLVGDPLGSMSEEFTLQAGSGSETGTTQWADYSQMALDPADDCTFWYTGTYQPVTSNQYTWATKIGAFRFPDCVADLAVTKSRSPSGLVEAGTNVTYTITVTNNGPNGAGNVTLTDAVPAATGLVSLSQPPGWSCTAPAVGSSGSISCTETIMANGESATLTVVATINCDVPNDTVIANTASASAATPPDNSGGNNAQTVSLTVSNPVPVVNASVTLSLLPQNNHDLVNVGLAATATDGACTAPTTFVVQVFGDEDDLTSPPNFSPDAKDLGVGTLRLREERDSHGDGRVYLVIVTATDTAGGTGFGTVTVVVPKSSSPADIASVNAQAAAAKAYADSHNGAAPPGYFVIGDGPVIGPKQ
jgi:uncharacterized repeat protein (TIGR01451 family)